MFFFFIGGIQPKTVTLEEGARICPVCGLNRLRLKRVDHYLSLFFIPLFPVKKGEPVLMCDKCGIVGDTFAAPLGTSETKRFTCPSCGRQMEQEFRYCPFCGRPL